MRRKGVTAAERIQERMETPAGSSENLRKRKVRLREVIDILNERGVEPIGAICDVLPQLDPSLQARTLLSLAEFTNAHNAGHASSPTGEPARRLQRFSIF